jgi:hypothetical protein
MLYLKAPGGGNLEICFLTGLEHLIHALLAYSLAADMLYLKETWRSASL